MTQTWVRLSIGGIFLSVNFGGGKKLKIEICIWHALAQPFHFAYCFLLVSSAKNTTQMYAVAVELLYPSFF